MSSVSGEELFTQDVYTKGETSRGEADGDLSKEGSCLRQMENGLQQWWNAVCGDA